MVTPALAPSRPRIDADRGGQARAQHAERRVAAVEHDAHRDALHDLGEVAGGVLRRDHAEHGAGAGGEASEWPWKTWPGSTSATTVAAGPAIMRASWSSLKLASTQRPCAGTRPTADRCRRDIGADLGGAVADIAVDRRADLGVAEVEPRGRRSACAWAAAASASAICAVSTLSCCCAASSPASAEDGGLGLHVQGVGALGVLAGAGVGMQKGAVARGVYRGEIGLGGFGGEIGADCWMVDCCSTYCARKPSSAAVRAARTASA